VENRTREQVYSEACGQTLMISASSEFDLALRGGMEGCVDSRNNRIDKGKQDRECKMVLQMTMLEDRENLLVHPIRSDQVRGTAEPFGHKGHEAYQGLASPLTKSHKATLAGKPPTLTTREGGKGRKIKLTTVELTSSEHTHPKPRAPPSLSNQLQTNPTSQWPSNSHRQHF
jgi:hypothetical protein